MLYAPCPVARLQHPALGTRLKEAFKHLATQVVYDPDVLPFESLLDTFWEKHDPTAKDRQGADRCVRV